jgi:hypothetical protein
MAHLKFKSILNYTTEKVLLMSLFCENFLPKMYLKVGKWSEMPVLRVLCGDSAKIPFYVYITILQTRANGKEIFK